MALKSKELAQRVMTALERFVARATEQAERRFETLLEQRVAAIPTIKGDPGEPGQPGEPGKPGPVGEKGDPGPAGVGIAKIYDTEDGTERTLVVVTTDGQEKAFPLLPGLPGAKGDAGPPGKDGPPGADGKQGEKGERGERGERGEKGEQGETGRDGLDGPPGRDALQVDPVELDPAKRYRKGEWATFRGGLLKASRATDAFPEDGDLEKAGWRVVINGLAEVAVEIGENDPRSFGVALKYTDGRIVMKTARLPVVLDRGVWKEGAYEQGDGVTWDGSFWIAQRSTAPGEKPKESDAWRLSVKRGSHGRDGLRGEKGERGAPGRDAVGAL